MSRRLILSVLAFAAVTSAAGAQDAAKVTGARGDFLGNFGGLERKFTQLAEAFPQDKYDWRPGAGVRSVCEVFVHITVENYDMGKAFGGPAAPAALGNGDKCIGKIGRAHV